MADATTFETVQEIRSKIEVLYEERAHYVERLGEINAALSDLGQLLGPIAVKRGRKAKSEAPAGEKPERKPRRKRGATDQGEAAPGT